jgi:hypothetical protein
MSSLTQAQGGVGGLTQQQHMMLLQQQQQSLAHQMLQQQHHAQAVAQQQLARSKEALMSVSAERRYFEQVRAAAICMTAVAFAVAVCCSERWLGNMGKCTHAQPRSLIDTTLWAPHLRSIIFWWLLRGPAIVSPYWQAIQCLGLRTVFSTPEHHFTWTPANFSPDAIKHPSVQVKEVLSTTSRETWSEFVKVLELFSNDVVSKEDCLDLIGDLFGPNHNDLFHEFKRLLNSR